MTTSALFDLSVVIVSYRCAAEIDLCLDRLVQDGLLGDLPDDISRPEIIVVDNASDDGTADVVAERYPGVRLLRQRENRGFAAGVNVGVAARTRKNVLLLNPDAVCPSATISELDAYLFAHPNVAAVGPSICGPDGEAHISSQRFPTFDTELARQWSRLAAVRGATDLGDAQPDGSGPVDWVSGACFMIRAEALDTVGTLDERFFLYFEETDWCRRAWELGWEIHCAPHLHCMHVGGASARAGKNKVRSGRVATHFRASRRRYFRKHHGLAVSIAVEVLHAARSAYLSIKGTFGRRGKVASS